MPEHAEDIEVIDAVTAATNEKMIEVRLRFWTNNLVGEAGEHGQIRPKHAWDKGVAIMTTNKTHGIKSEDPTPFNSMMEITQAVEKVLLQHGVKLHSGDRSRKLIVK
jgi:hypothetical protein